MRIAYDRMRVTRPKRRPRSWRATWRDGTIHATHALYSDEHSSRPPPAPESPERSVSAKGQRMHAATRKACAPSCAETWMASSCSRASSDCGTNSTRGSQRSRPSFASKPEFEKERRGGAESPREASLKRCVGVVVYEETGPA